MAYADPAVQRLRDRERFARRTAERVAAGLCPRCGERPPASERSVCDPCAAKRNRASRARDARLRAAGKPRRDPTRARSYERGRSRKERVARQAEGMCTRCGKLPAADGRSSCEPCLEKRRAADRAKYAAGKSAGLKYGGADADAKRRAGRAKSKRRQKQRIEAGLCIRCGRHSPVEGGTTCRPCRDKRQAAERQQYAERRAAGCCTPERDEFDTRELWDAADALDAVAESFRILAQGVGPDGFQLADERESLLWGFVNMLDGQVRRLDRAADRLMPELRDLQRAQDGTEIKSRELELTTDRAQNLTHRRDAFEQMRDAAAEQYRSETGDTWRPWRGSHASQTGKLTSAAIDARDFQRARKDRETTAHLPQGTLVAIAGGKDVADPAAVIAKLDQTRAKYADIVLVHGGGPGVERIAARWAERNGVDQVVCKPDWDRHGRAAPFRRNEELLQLLPKGVIAFPGSGITENLVDRARQLGIPVMAA